MKKPPVCIILLCALALGGCDSPGSDEEPEEPVISPDPRTTAVSFAPTGDNSADVYFDLDAWTLEEAGEHWRIAVLEQGSVSFTVRKMAAQSIDVGGSAAAWVSQAPEGGEADGSMAGPELALFTVDTALILDGGERAFTLTIREPDKEPRTVEVGLEVEANLEQGVGVFFVEAGGRLTRISPENAETYANEYYAQDRAAGFERSRTGNTAWRINFAEVDDLFDALIWVDQYAKSGTPEQFQEYRIRVEKGEALISTALTCGDGSLNRPSRADYVGFTLWGYKEERTITKDALYKREEIGGTYHPTNTNNPESLITVGTDKNISPCVWAPASP